MENGGGNTRISTFIWTIKNFSRWYELRDGALQSRYPNILLSPCFAFDPSKSIRWLLGISSDDGCPQMSYAISSTRALKVEESIEVDFELSFLAADSSSLIAKRAQKSFSRLDKFTFMSFACKYEILVTRREEFLPNDTLTARCRIWNKTSNQFENPVVFLGRTEILIDDGSSVLKVERFSSLKVGQDHEFNVGSNTHALSPMTVSIYLGDNGDDVQIDVADSDKSAKRSIHVMLEFSAIDVTGNIIDSTISQMWFKNGSTDQFPVFLTKSELMANKLMYLPNDTLILRCSYPFLYVNEIECFSSMPKSIKANANVPSEQNRRTEENYCSHSLPIIKDLRNVYEKGILSDLNIRVGTENFAAHKLILSSRSPVFMTMFTTDMKEKNAMDIDLPDLDSETVRMMLKYMYTDVVEDLLWDSATRLYFAADNYQLLPLKDTCSGFLKANLSTLNVCEALSLADMHHDDELKSGIQDFVYRHHKEIINSKEWKHLKASHKQLALETMEFLYLKRL